MLMQNSGNLFKKYVWGKFVWGVNVVNRNILTDILNWHTSFYHPLTLTSTVLYRDGQ